MSKLPDIDLDFGDRSKALDLIQGINASIIKNDVITKHNSGVYYTKIPNKDGVATIDYNSADDRGYFKLDLLNVSIYQKINDKEHLDRLSKQEAPWDMLWTCKEFCEQVTHIGNHYDLVCSMKPDTIPRMAMFLSIIRPGKAHLQKKSWKEIGETIWLKPENNQYHFKKAHAVAYAHLVVLHMNILYEEYMEMLNQPS